MKFMKKLFLFFGLLFSVNSVFALYYDWGVSDALTYYLGATGTNGQAAVFLNQADISVRFNLDDDLYFKAVVRNDSMSLTNVLTNYAYLKELNVDWTGSFFELAGGRRDFSIGSGYIIGMPGDGLNVDVVFFKTHLNLVTYTTALLPPVLDALHLNLEDATNGAKRFVAGTRMARNGLIGDETAIGFYLLYDLKNTNNLYQPWYIELNQKGAIFSALAYNLNIFYEGGQNGSLPVSAYAGELDFMWQIFKKSDMDLGLEFNIAFASGDEDRSGLYPENITNGTDNQFIAPGKYANGIVLYPDFSNLLAFRMSLFFNYGKTLSTVLNVANYNKMNAAAPMSDIYANQNAMMLGTEISTSLLWHIDYSLDLSVSGGVLLKSDAYPIHTPNYKLLTTCSVRL